MTVINQRSTGATRARGPRALALAYTTATLAVALAFLLMFAPILQAAPAPEKAPDVRIAFSKDAYWYKPGSAVNLFVTLDNRTQQPVSGIDVRFRIHARNASRADLDQTFAGKPVKSYRQTETVGRNLTLSPGNNSFRFQVTLASGITTAGVYPVTIEALQNGTAVASAVSELVIYSPVDSADLVPLKLSIVFDTLEPDHRGPDGVFKGDELAAECDPSGRQPGWYTRLLAAIEKWQGLSASVSMSPMLLDEIVDMTNGYSMKKGETTVVLGPDSRQAVDAAGTLSGLRKLAQSARAEILPAPSSSPNLETMVSLRWVSDALGQMTAGHKSIEKNLDTSLGWDFFCPPGLAANSRVLRDLGAESGKYMLLSSDLLQRSKEGKRLTRGQTLSQPVQVLAEKKGQPRVALFQDARMRALFERVSQSGDANGVTQCIIAELTNLYLENPDTLRTCAVVWPSWWRPSRAVLDEVFKAITSAPWIKTATLAESIMQVKALDNDPLDIPEQTAPTDQYFTEVSRARDRYKGFAKMVMPDNPLLPQLQENIWVSESDVWRQWDRKVDGISYATAAIKTIDGEVAKVDIPAMGSISLTAASAKIPISVLNGTSYRIAATLQVASNGLTFPGGTHQKVKLEPKENILEIPVKVKKKGRVRFQARLETDTFILGEVDFTVRTSRFNTFAILVVGGLLVLIGGIWVTRVASRRKVGKHKRRNLPGNGEEAPQQGSETPA